MKITTDEWSRACNRGHGQFVNGKRMMFIPSTLLTGPFGKWVEVELAN
jgi:hypothetical protein